MKILNRFLINATTKMINVTNKTRKPCYRRENGPMLLQISIRIEFYNGITRAVSVPQHGFLVGFVCRLQ